MNFSFSVRHDVYIHFSADRAAEEVSKKLDHFKQEQSKMNAELQEKIESLRASVARLDTVDESVKAFIAKIPQLIQDAVDKAVANGVTPEQLAAFDELKAGIEQSANELAAAITTPGPGDPDLGDKPEV